MIGCSVNDHGRDVLTIDIHKIKPIKIRNAQTLAVMEPIQMEEGLLSMPLALALALALALGLLLVLLTPVSLLPMLAWLAWLVSMVGVEGCVRLEVVEVLNELDISTCEDLVINAKVLQELDEVIVKLS